MLLLDAFNKDRASLPQPLTNTSQPAPLPAAVPDPHIQEMINEKLKKAEDLGQFLNGFQIYNHAKSTWTIVYNSDC